MASKKSVSNKKSLAPKKSTKTLKKIKARSPSLPSTFKKLRNFIDKNQDNELALEASFYLGEILKKQNKKKKACKVYKKAAQLPFAHIKDRKVFFLYSDCLFQRKKVTAALKFLETQMESSTPVMRKKLAKKQWGFLKNQKLPYWKLVVLNHLATYSPSIEAEQWIKKGEALIQNLNEEDFLMLEENRTSLGLFEGELLFQAGKKKWAEADFKKAKAYFKQAHQKFSSTGRKLKKTSNYLKALKARLFVNPYLIGAILPLSGHRKALGEKVLKGLNLGLGITDNSRWQIVAIDSGSHPDITQQAVETLLYDYHVIGIVGGLSGDTARVIAETAEEFGIPSLLLSQKQSLAQNRLFIFQSALSGKALMEHLSENLIQNLKIKKAALLFPEDNYGKYYVNLFKETFQAKGGHIVRGESYKTGEVDFKNVIKKLVNLFDLKSRKKEYETLKQEFLKKQPEEKSGRGKKLTPEHLLEPEVDFQALFVPDSLKVLKQIVSYLKYFDIKDIHLVGTNLWKKERLMNWKEDFSLVFSGTADVEEKILLKSPFYVKYRKAFNSNPGFFERQAYNTALALRTALENKPKDRFQLQKALESVKSFQGAFFTLKISKDHTFSYPLKLYEIKGKNRSH